MKRAFACLFVIAAMSCLAENYVLEGGQSSHIQYSMQQEVVPSAGMKSLSISLVVPETFHSPSYNQEIKDFRVIFSTEPSNQREERDKRGNLVRHMEWQNPSRPVNLDIQIQAVNFTRLEVLETDAVFPMGAIPPDIQPYLQATRQVPSDHKQIVAKAEDLTRDSENQFDAVQQILSWIVDHMRYVLRPESYDAIYSIKTGKGNCQNYSHLAATFMRAVRIPVRIVNGITLEEPYNIRMDGGTMTLHMAKARHSWVEVWFSDMGWVPFDPQQMQLFVSNRFIRIEVGLDNNEAIHDGRVRFRLPKGSAGRPRFRESFAANFIRDEVDLRAEPQGYGPKKLLFTPPVEAEFAQILYEASSVPPMVIAPAELAALSYSESDTMGNLDFPEGIDFLETRDVTTGESEDELVLRKNFLAETAEYVTTNGKKYAQTFILENPMQLEWVGLALHKFGGSGDLWIELFEDDGSGKPGNLIVASDILSMDRLRFQNGYRWEDFEFSGDPVRLSPGRYWIALAYTGSPVLNWFFTYGKPVGPTDGTRYNTLFDETWSHSLSYEFNYRVIGKKPH